VCFEHVLRPDYSAAPSTSQPYLLRWPCSTYSTCCMIFRHKNVYVSIRKDGGVLVSMCWAASLSRSRDSTFAHSLFGTSTLFFYQSMRKKITNRMIYRSHIVSEYSRRLYSGTQEADDREAHVKIAFTAQHADLVLAHSYLRSFTFLFDHWTQKKITDRMMYQSYIVS
jgi:hypothetical protein